MIITCPQCSSQFNVQDSMITPAGRKVKCSNCSHQWSVKLSADGAVLNQKLQQPTPQQSVQQQQQADQQPNQDEKKEGLSPSKKAYNAANAGNKSFLDSSIFRKSMAFGMLLSLITLGGVNIFIHQEKIVEAFPFAQDMYASLGLTNDAGIKLKAVDCKVSDDSQDGADLIELDVKVDLINMAQIEQKIGSVRFSVYDKERVFLGDYSIDFSKSLEPQAVETIEGRLDKIPKAAMFVIVDIGGPLEVTLRNRSHISSY